MTRTRRLMKALGAALALAGVLTPFASDRTAQAAVGSHYGYVATRGVVYEDAGSGNYVPVWAEYAPDRLVNAGDRRYFVPGKPERLHLAVEQYENAVVLTRDEYVFQQQAYEALRANEAGRFEIVRRDTYMIRRFVDRLGREIPKRPLRPGTTHLALRLESLLEPSGPHILHEFPLDPQLAAQVPVVPPGQTPADELKTFLISVQPSHLGQVLKASKGIITYLADYISPFTEEDGPRRFGFCAQTPESSIVLGGKSYTTWDDFYRFQACDPWLIKNLWAPIQGAFLDCGARYMFNEPGAVTDARGRFELSYPYINGHTFWDDVYLSLNFAPFDPRVPFGSRYFDKQRVQAGAFLETNIGAVGLYGLNLPFVGSVAGDLMLAHGTGALLDTQKPRPVNIGVEVAYMVGQVVLTNRSRPGIDIEAAQVVTIDDDTGVTTYAYAKPDYAPRVQRPYTLSEQGALVAVDAGAPADAGAGGPSDAGAPDAGGALPPVVSQVEPQRSEVDGGGPDPDGQVNPGDIERANDVVDRGLLERIRRADLSKTDYFLFGPDGRLLSSRSGLRSNETYGLTCTNVTGLPFGTGPTCTLDDDQANGPAAFNLQDFVLNRYPGARYRIIAINRATGYVGTGSASVGAVGVSQSSLRAVTIVPDLGAGEVYQGFVEMRPPNLSVKVERLRAQDRGTLTDLGSDAPGVIGFEGAGLTTDEYIAVTTEWYDWNGAPLPPDLPGLTGRIARVLVGTTLHAVGANGALDAGDALPIGHFEIKPGKQTQFVRLPDPENLHYYIHVSGADPNLCRKGNCPSFASPDRSGPLRYRPALYAPFKVPVFDELATRAALSARVAIARERAQQTGQHQVVERVAPVYTWVYRPEYQFSVYELPEITDTALVTRYDADRGRGSTTLTFDYELSTRDKLDPLEPFGPGQNPIISVGYDELLATLNQRDAKATFDDLERLVALTPAQQVGQITDIASKLTPADYVGLQIYLDNDRGNALYQDYSFGYPLIVTDVHPIQLQRRENLATFGAEIAMPRYIDDFLPIAFELTRRASVRGFLTSLDGQPSGEAIPRQELDPGRHYVIVDAGRLRELTPSTNFLLNLEATPVETTGSRTPHRVEFPVSIVELRSSRMLGEIVEHDVNILDGSLRLSRTDFVLEGRGPQLAMMRSYTNLGGDPDGLLGMGWSHSYDLQLVPLATDQYLTASVPEWVVPLRGRFVSPAQVEPNLFPPTPPAITAVSVNGTTFRQIDGIWRREHGRHGTLELTSSPCVGPPGSSSGCFVFTSKDGTEYRYDVPAARAPTAPVLGTSPTTLSLGDGLATRLGYGLHGELQLPGVPSGQPGTPGVGPSPTVVRSITDAFGNTSQFGYDGEGRVRTVTDAVGRSCTFDYDPGAVACPTDYVASDRLRRVTCLDIIVTYCYDTKGNLAQVQRGRRLETYGYVRETGTEDGGFNLVSTRSAEGSLHEYHYMAPGQPLPSGLELGPLTRHEIVERVEYPPTMTPSGPARANVMFTYSGRARTVSDMLPSPSQTPERKRYTLNAHGNPVRIEEPRGKVTELEWSIDGPGTRTDNVLVERRVTQRAGVVLTTTFEYDGQGNLTLERGPGSRETRQTFNEFGSPLTRIDFRGVQEAWTYDGRGFLLTHTDGAGVVTRFTEHPQHPGQAGTREVVDATPARVIEFDYDQYGNPAATRVRGIAGTERVTVYDARGRLQSQTNALGSTTRNHYSTNDELELVELPNLPEGVQGERNLVSTFDADGNKLSESDRNGLTLTYTYTGRGQVQAVTRSGGGARQFRYDLRGNIRSETDWEGVATRYTYDDLGYRETTTNRVGDVMTARHDLVGNVLETTDFGGLVTHYEYDDLNREIRHYSECSGCDDVVTEYLGPGVAPEAYRVRVTNERNFSTTSGYDGRGLLVRRADALGNVATSKYDSYGNVTETRDEEGFVTTYEYDARGFRTAVVSRGKSTGASLRTEFEHDANGNVRHERRWRRQGDASTLIHVETRYDAWNRLIERIDPEGRSETFAYDGEGNLLRHQDQAGRIRSWTRNARGDILSHTDAETRARSAEVRNACGATVCYEDYDLNGNARRLVDVRGHVTLLTLDEEERLETVREAVGTPVERSFAIVGRDGMGNPLSVRDGNLTTREFAYNAQHLLKTATDPLSRSTHYTYTPTGKVRTITTPRAFTRTFGYDPLDRVTTVRYPNESTLEAETTYDNVGNPRTVQDRFGSVTENIYDSFLRVRSVRRYHVSGSGGNVEVQVNVYDDVGNVVDATDANGQHTRFEFDNRNLLVRTIQPGAEPEEERSERRTYDAAGNLRTLSLPSRAGEGAFESVHTYDRENRLLSVTTPGNASGETEITSYAYDLAGNRVRETRPEGQDGARHAGKSRTFQYDALNRLEKVVDEVGLAMSYEHDRNDNLRHVRGPYPAASAPGGPHVEYTYDAGNRPTSQRQELEDRALVTSFTAYDGHDNLTGLTDAMGRQFTYEYDHYDRRTVASYPSVPTPFRRPASTTYSFDDAARTVTVTQNKLAANGDTLTDVRREEYDRVFGRLTSTTTRGVTVSYQYDLTGNRTGVTSPAGSTTYTYDARNRLETATIGAALTRYEYYPDGRLERVTLGNGTRKLVDYFASRRVQTIRHEFAGGGAASVAYTYDRNGNTRSQSETRDSLIDRTDFDVYDAADRLESFTQGGRVTRYTYERYNRKTERVTAGANVLVDRTYTYDRAERLTTVSDQGGQPFTINYTYDDNGNTRVREVSNAPGERMEFHYDSRDALVQSARGPPGSSQILGRYDYDDRGLRIRHLDSERGDVETIYDDDAVLEERATLGGVVTTSRYHYGEQVLTRAAQRGSDALELEYYHQDKQGTTHQLSDGAGAIVGAYKHDPFGNVREQTGDSENRLTYTGQEYDGRTGLYYYGARYYDPLIGRFLTQDTYLGDLGTPPSLHRYLYAHSNPIRFVDPTGHYVLDPVEESLNDARQWLARGAKDLNDLPALACGSDGGWFCKKATGLFARQMARVHGAGMFVTGTLELGAQAADYAMAVGGAAVGAFHQNEMTDFAAQSLIDDTSSLAQAAAALTKGETWKAMGHGAWDTAAGALSGDTGDIAAVTEFGLNFVNVGAATKGAAKALARLRVAREAVDVLEDAASAEVKALGRVTAELPNGRAPQADAILDTGKGSATTGGRIAEGMAEQAGVAKLSMDDVADALRAQAPVIDEVAKAPKGWQDFLPAAQDRLAAAKLKYGDNPSILNMAQDGGGTADFLTLYRAQPATAGAVRGGAYLRTLEKTGNWAKSVRAHLNVWRKVTNPENVERAVKALENAQAGGASSPFISTTSRRAVAEAAAQGLRQRGIAAEIITFRAPKNAALNFEETLARLGGRRNPARAKDAAMHEFGLYDFLVPESGPSAYGVEIVERVTLPK